MVEREVIKVGRGFICTDNGRVVLKAQATKNRRGWFARVEDAKFYGSDWCDCAETLKELFTKFDAYCLGEF